MFEVMRKDNGRYETVYGIGIDYEHEDLPMFVINRKFVGMVSVPSDEFRAYKDTEHLFLAHPRESEDDSSTHTLEKVYGTIVDPDFNKVMLLIYNEGSGFEFSFEDLYTIEDTYL